ncbi:alkaline-phosphatase-like protein [Sporodiniella umbellata]|nr:alkaline-phosphatase-like protein [Sporodiniella umbellata]
MNKKQNEPLLNDSEENLQTEDWIIDQQSSNKKFWVYVGFFSIFFSTAVVAVISSSKVPPNLFKKNIDHSPKNIIMMISDGLGPASVSFARTYHQYTNNKPYDYQMPLDTIHIGQSRTRSSSSLVTDSAAGATAFSCNTKTFNGAIAVGPDKRPCGTVLESAKHTRGMLTALVTTSRITHATPASFSSHVVNRNNEKKIAQQQIGENPLGRSVDLMFGGGYCHFLPRSSKDSCRKDDRDLLNEAKNKYSWKTVIYKNKTAFDTIPIDPSVLPASPFFYIKKKHMAYEIDRVPEKEPSLSDMSKKALEIMYKSAEDKKKGFFMMIEGSRIDMAAHSNDAAAHVHEILEYQRTVELVKKFVDEHPDTIMISTSDHETGGLSLARQVSSSYPDYLWYPDVLTKVKSSTARLATLISKSKQKTRRFVVNGILEKYLGITDATEQEIRQLLKPGTRVDYYLADMVSIRAQLGWATHGHSGVDVNLYAYGRGSQRLAGSHENTEIGKFITESLGLDLDDMTERLNVNNTSFHLGNLTTAEKLEYNKHLEHYHHNPSYLKHLEF